MYKFLHELYDVYLVYIVYLCIYVFMFVCVYMYLCMFAYIYVKICYNYKYNHGIITKAMLKSQFCKIPNCSILFSQIFILSL